MQDSKEETPLFLAAREGSYEAAKILLDHFANREITDHLDRLPRDIAHERLHHDIVRLLDEHSAGRSPPGGLAPAHALSPLVCPPGGFLPGLKPAPGSKKSRRPSAKGAGVGAGTGPGKEPKGRGKKLSLECPGGLLESSVTLSPVDSLDSPYVANPTSPGLASPGVFHTGGSALSVPGLLETPFAVSLARLGEAGEASGTLLSMGRVGLRPPGCMGLGLGMVSPVAVPFEWHARPPAPVIGVVHPATSHPNLHQSGQAFAPGLLLPGPMTVLHSSQVLGSPGPGAKEPTPAPSTAMPPPAPGPARGEGQGQGGSRPPQYFKAPGGPGAEEFQTAPPPPGGGYAEGRYLRVPSEHPYLTPSPESPEQWASPSPRSLSDWSEGTGSPAVLPPNQTQLPPLPDPPAKMQVFA
ncbi:neurogenic locus notch-like protein 3-like [Alligator mississippiensis]|uniref:Neurogenic locus notch-like protein 3-like n=2 Tax=Alligator mississippiensis TaxID=8496 RepID=A0A151MRU5_ALLMI|nr:neurogenic locus notch-like protein 3-like [Alligator mississippiensis]